jgi:hypothetical protein
MTTLQYEIAEEIFRALAEGQISGTEAAYWLSEAIVWF